MTVLLVQNVQIHALSDCTVCHTMMIHTRYRYELLSKVAAKYCSSVSEKLSQIERMEKDLDAMVTSLSQSMEEIDNSARKAQEKLERHFAGTEAQGQVLVAWL